MEFRHEWKHEINVPDALVLRQRLRTALSPDENAINGSYQIRSLYFDTPTDTALHEKLDGVSRREKFRIRYYNGDTGLIHLEKKSKLAGLGNKQTAALTEEETRSILDGNTLWMQNCDRALVRELHAKMTLQGLRPKTIVDYTREAFVYAPGNVRVTLDRQLRTGIHSTDFLNPDCVTVPAGNAPIILEVKWDSFLPSLIRDLVQLDGRRTTAFSKYAACRIYG